MPLRRILISNSEDPSVICGRVNNELSEILYILHYLLFHFKNVDVYLDVNLNGIRANNFSFLSQKQAFTNLQNSSILN